MHTNLTNYRCPKCNSLHSVQVNKIFDGRLIFQCSKCKICAIISSVGNIDEAYLNFLDRYEGGFGVAHLNDLKLLMEQEKIIRSSFEIDALIAAAKAAGDPLLEQTLHSQQDYLVDFQTIEEAEPELGLAVDDLPVDEAIINVLKSKNIHHVYKFQEEAIKEILCGHDVVITAPTSSGKTEAFCIPILQEIAQQLPHFGSLRSAEGKVSAIFIYPTKALSRDQLPKIKELADPLGLRVAVIDGDTLEKERSSLVFAPPDIIITNFDTLHYHMMHRTKLSRMLQTARFLLADEAHVYTGVFGANVHHIIGRLERLLGRRLQIIAASATLPNAAEFCQTLFGRKMNVVQGRGRRGRINLAIIFPSLRSHRSLALDLLRESTKSKHRAIVFANSHLSSELMAFYGKRQGINIKVHRGGLIPMLRKEIEQEFKSGQLMALSATSTLELGIDIGDIDTVISNIVPITRLVQRIGRAARRGQQGYAFLALSNDPISQYYKMHPEDYLADHEWAFTDPTNPFVQEYQILAMTCDRPLLISESEPVWTILQKLISRGIVKAVRGKFVPNLKDALRVLDQYSIRGIGSKIDIKFNNKILGERALPQALEELHQNAIYFLAGRRYKVKQLYFEQNSQPYAELAPIPYDYPYYTKALTDEWPSIEEIYEKKDVFGVEVAYCSLKIQKRVLGYSNIEIGQDITQGKKLMMEKPLEYEFVTKGLVFRAPRPLDILQGVEDQNYVKMSGFHASEHVIIEGSAMITGGASQDLGGISLGSTGLIFVYDGSIGGNGASRILYDRLHSAFGRSLRILSECSCNSESGCPRCTYSYRCGNNNEFLHKHAAIEVMNRIVEGEKTEIGEKVWGERALV
ncbi:MAG: DEAD/DEAH box helicase [Thermoproteota archaeon]|nr:DEAD/DEAH box helicase [Thermoproteota archaeon]